MRQSVVAGFAITLALMGAGGDALQAQDTTKLSFDVSTVRPHDQTDPGMSWGDQNGSLKCMNVTVKNLIAAAWGVRPDQVAGEPVWADDEHWDVTAKVTDAEEAVLKKLTRQDRERMEQILLAERFHLKAHLESRVASVFNLVPAKGGIKLKMLQSAVDDDKPDSSLMPRGSMMMRTAAGGSYEMTGHGINMQTLLGNIAGNLRQTVIDQTGVASDALFDFKLNFALETGTDARSGDAPSLREALETQLGLRLEAARGPVATVVVDHVEKPTAN